MNNFNPDVDFSFKKHDCEMKWADERYFEGLEEMLNAMIDYITR